MGRYPLILWPVLDGDYLLFRVYTQSQKKRTMDPLTCPATQGQGQVPPAGSYLIMRNCPIFRILLFVWVDMHSNNLKLWENGEEFWNGVFCMRWPGTLARWFTNPALPNYTLRKKNATFQLSQGLNFHCFTCNQTAEYCERTVNNFWIGFFACCHQQHRQNALQAKCPTKFIYLHFSQNEMQLSTVHFFWDRVEIMRCVNVWMVKANWSEQ